MIIQTFTGGLADTNCFLIENEAGSILIDAPQESAEWLLQQKKKVSLLLLTHAHFDHVWDAARIQREHGCKVGCHPDSLPMLSEPGFFRRFGFEWDIEPLQADLLLEESASQVYAGIDFQTLLVPGHCPGSLCFFAKSDRILFGGDVLFAGSVGRTDLPGGDWDLLMSGIKGKIFPLGDDVKVLPGHGPATTIGRERKTNPFLS